MNDSSVDDIRLIRLSTFWDVDKATSFMSLISSFRAVISLCCVSGVFMLRSIGSTDELLKDPTDELTGDPIWDLTGGERGWIEEFTEYVAESSSLHSCLDDDGPHDCSVVVGAGVIEKFWAGVRDGASATEAS